MHADKEKRKSSLNRGSYGYLVGKYSEVPRPLGCDELCIRLSAAVEWLGCIFFSLTGSSWRGHGEAFDRSLLAMR